MAKARKTTTARATKGEHPSPFTLEGAKFYGPIIEKAVGAALAEYGVRVNFCKMTYGFSAKAMLELAGSDVTESAEGKVWASQHRIFGLPADALGKTFESEGRKFTIVGLNPRKRRKPVVMKWDKDPHPGRRWFASAESVLLRLNASKAARVEKKRKERLSKDEDDSARRVPKTKVRSNVDQRAPKTKKAAGKAKAPKTKAKPGRRYSTF